MDKFHTAQRLQDSSIDLTINNPLSQAEDSPWNQHFQDAELRKLVQQDVVRVFPDLEFFQSNSIKEKLLNILFLYARTHQDIGYRQVKLEINFTLFTASHHTSTKENIILLGINCPEFFCHLVQVVECTSNYTATEKAGI